MVATARFERPTVPRAVSTPICLSIRASLIAEPNQIATRLRPRTAVTR